MHVNWYLPCLSAPGDYAGVSLNVSIPAGSIKVTLPLTTLKDSTVEADEYFKAALTLPGAPVGCIVGTPDTAYITVTDGTCMLRFDSMHLIELMS